MPRIIFKCPYTKPGTEKATAHRGNYVRYVATRDGVEKLTPDQAGLPATKKQRAMVEQILKDFPMSREMFEYEDYLASLTRGSASEFITRAIENNYDQVAKLENYVGYIAQRPRAERLGSHGLFNGTDESITLSKVSEEVANHSGNVWLPIISLRREDAARLGYDNARRWQRFLRSYAMEMAEAMKIPWDRFRWYAAYHDEGHHPHVHMVCYSADGTSGYLTREGIAKIKAGLVKEIFKQDLTELYQQQTQRRDELVRKSGEVMEDLIQQMRSGTLDNPRIEQLITQLAQRLKSTSGKKQYGYLSASLKAVVNEIVDELAKDARIAAAYDLWYQLREEVLRTYRNDLPRRIPLSQQKEFKRIKNLVIEEAVRLGMYTEVFPPTDTQEGTEASEETAPQDTGSSSPHDAESDRDMNATLKHLERTAMLDNPCAKYRIAKHILADLDSDPERTADAVEWLIQAAEAGLTDAQYTLGKLYRDGRVVERDDTRAAIWFSQAAERENPQAMYTLGKLYLEAGNLPAALRCFQRPAELGNQYAQYQLGKLLLSGEGVPKDAQNAIRWLTESAKQGNPYAQYALGKLYLLGEDVARDRETAAYWLTLAAERGDPHAQYFLDHMNDSPSPLACATRLLHHMGNIFREQTPPPSGGMSFVDSKLRRKIREKKIAMGHKPDDHEDPEITQRQV